MKNTLGVLLLAGALAPACNSKSPETTATSAQDEPKETASAVQEPAPPAEPPPPPKDPAIIDGATHVAYDLLANRPLAHRRQWTAGGPGAMAAVLGARSGLRYVAGNHGREWTQLPDGKGLALRKSRKGSLLIPSTTTDAGVLEATVFNPLDRPNELTFTVNGEKLGALSVEPGWQTVQTPVPASAMRHENAVEVEFASMGRIEGDLSGGALGVVRLGEAIPTSILETADVARAQDALRVSPVLGGAAWTVWALPDSRLKLDVAGPDGCDLQARWYTESGGELTLAGQKDLPVGETWVDPELKRELYRFEILPKSETCTEGAVVESANLVLAGEQPKVPEAKPPKHIIFWMIDTLRADHLPIHFETDVRAPNLQRLAAEGASFPLAYVQGNESKASHASLFSGMFPSKHGVKTRGHLKPFHHLLPEAMKDGGYKTYAFISNGYVSEPWGFVQGWDMYRNNLRSGYGITAPAMVKHGLDWTKDRTGEKFFLYLGTIDPHVTYRMHEDLIGLYDDPEYDGRFRRSLLGTTLGEIATKKVSVTEREQQRIKALYKNEITYNDRAFGELRQGLEDLGVWDETMVVVTADHGEYFWEHGGVGHGSGVHQQVVHVPLIVYYPPLVPGGTVVEAGVDVLDIYPTLVHATSNERKYDELQGRSLLPLIHRVRGDYPEPAIATHYTTRYGVQMQQWKLIVKKGSYELFDRSADPQELTDVSGKHPLAERWLHDAFAVYRPLRKEWSKEKFGAASNLSPDFIAMTTASKDDEEDSE